MKITYKTSLKDNLFFLPFYGEYGLFIIHHIRCVHFSSPANYKIVCCEKGDEVYFPSANEFHYDWPRIENDSLRKRLGKRWILKSQQYKIYEKEIKNTYTNYKIISTGLLKQFKPMSKTFALNSKAQIQPIDIILAPRKREYKTNRNYDKYEELACKIKDLGFTVGCVGAKNTSYILENSSYNSWDSEIGNGNAVVNMLQNCKLYIGSDSGVTHLAAFLSVPILYFALPDNSGYTFNLMKESTKNFIKDIGDNYKNTNSIIDEINCFFKERQWI